MFNVLPNAEIRVFTALTGYRRNPSRYVRSALVAVMYKGKKGARRVLEEMHYQAAMDGGLR